MDELRVAPRVGEQIQDLIGRLLGTQPVQTAAHVKKIMRRQKLLLLLFIVVAIVALLLNRFLISSPIQRSVDKLDQRKPLPVEGSYEVRHLANVYNEVLKDNAEKTEALSYAATHDALTGLYNRGEFDRVYSRAENEKVGVMIADVDRFKQFNDLLCWFLQMWRECFIFCSALFQQIRWRKSI